MSVTSNMQTAPALSARLKAETADLHQKLDALVMAARPFESRENYGRFVRAQYLFQRDIESLYDDPRLLEMIPDLPTRPRLAAAAADLADLGIPVPAELPAPVADTATLADGLGWLYVSEGSKLGAAFLFKEAGQKLGLSETLGARSLAAPAGGRGAAWKGFVHALDNTTLGVAELDHVVRGARHAFERFAVLLAYSFPRRE